MNENMENVVMGEVKTEIPADVVETSLGGKIVGGLIVGGVVMGVGALVRKGYKWAKNKIQAKKDKKAADVVDVEYTEVTAEEESVQ